MIKCVSFNQKSNDPLNNFERHLMKKSLIYINLDSIDFGRRCLVRRLLAKAQSDMRKVGQTQKIHTMRLHKVKKQEKNIYELIPMLNNITTSLMKLMEYSR